MKFIFSLFILFPWLAPAQALKKQTALSDAAIEVQNFYKCYLNKKVFLKKPLSSKDICKDPLSFFSKEAQSLIAKNLNFCKEKFPKELCGFGSGGDIFLNAQDFSNNLDFKKSNFKIESDKNNEVLVTFNVLASKNFSSAQRKIKLVMILENSAWRADDIFYMDDPSDSMRKMIANEMQSFQ